MPTIVFQIQIVFTFYYPRIAASLTLIGHAWEKPSSQMGFAIYILIDIIVWVIKCVSYLLIHFNNTILTRRLM